MKKNKTKTKKQNKTRQKQKRQFEKSITGSFRSNHFGSRHEKCNFCRLSGNVSQKLNILTARYRNAQAVWNRLELFVDLARNFHNSTSVSRPCYFLSIEAPSTRIRKFVKTQIFFCEYGLRPHVSSVFSGRIRKFLKTLSRVEIFLSDTNSYTCGRSYPQICEYAYVIFLNPVYTSSIINKHAVQQGCIFFVNCSDF